MNKSVQLVLGVIGVIGIIGLLYARQRQPVENLVGNESGTSTTGEVMEKKTLDKPLVIGAIVPLTGDGAAYGIPLQQSAQIALKEINDAGGIGGQPVVVVWEDGKCDAKEATAAAQKLINIDKVKIIFGGVCSSETLAVAPLAEEARVLVISPSATSPKITDAGEFIFRTAPSDAFAGRVAAEYAYKKLGKKTAAVISETTDYAQGLREVFTKVFEALGGEVVVDETFNTRETDFSTALIKVKASNPDVIYLLPQTPAPGVQLIKQLAAQGITTPRLTAEVLIGRDIVAENAEQMEGLIGIESYFNENGPKAKSFLAQYRADSGQEPAFPFFMANMHGQFFLIKDGIEQVGLDTEKLRDWLTGLRDWEGTMGKLSLDEKGEPVLDYAVKQVKDGKLEEREIFSTR